MTDRANSRFRNPDPIKRGARLSSMDGKRFAYRRMTADDLTEMLREIDLAPNSFCRIFGVTPQVVHRWLKGEQDIPIWVFPALYLMREAPNGLAIARSASALHIEFDNDHPDRGRFPYAGK